VATPGTLFDPLRFVEAVRRAQAVYAEGHHVQYVTSGFFSHLAGILHYLVRDLLSPFLLAGLALSGAAVVGAIDLWRRERKVATVLAVFPVFYALYFSSQAMLIVRNLLALAPMSHCSTRQRGHRRGAQTTGRSIAGSAPAKSTSTGTRRGRATIASWSCRWNGHANCTCAPWTQGP